MDPIPSIEEVMSYDTERLKMILDMRKVKYRLNYARIDYLSLVLSTLGYDCPYLNIEDINNIDSGKRIDIDLPRIMRTLFTIQREHVNIMVKILKGRVSALESSDTGTGKTLMSLCIGLLLDMKIFIVTPSRVVPGWLDVIATNEVNSVIGVSSYERLVSSQTYYDPNDYDYNIIDAVEAEENNEVYNPMKRIKPKEFTYLSRISTKKKDRFIWKRIKNTLFVFDEAQMAKNKNTLNSNLVVSCYEYIKSHPERNNKLLLVTATPTDKEEHIPYLAYILDLIPEMKKREVTNLLRRVSGPTYISAFVKLRSIIYDPLRPIGHRITKEQVEEVLGLQYPVTVSFQAFEMDKAAEREIEKQNQLIATLLESLRDKESTSALAQIVTARRIIELQKVPTFAKLAREAIKRGRYVIIFVEYHDTSSALVRLLSKYDPQLITGEVNIDERQVITKDYQRGKFNLLIMHIGVGGVGISLHDIVGGKPRSVFISPTWGGIICAQTLGRADRLCKKSDVEQTIVYARSAVEGEISMDQRLAEVMTKKLTNIKELDLGESADTFMRKLYTQASQKINVGKSPTKITVDISAVITKKDDICNLEINQSWPLDGVKVIVMDFDGVIIGGNSCRQRDIYGPFIAKSFIPYAQQHGYIVAIASFARKETILRVLYYMGASIPNELIITPIDVGWAECHGPPDGKSKNDMLRLIATRTDILPEHITLLDDTLANVENAIAAGYRAILISQLSPQGGFIGNHLGGIKELDGALDSNGFQVLWNNWSLKEGYWVYTGRNKE